MGMTLLHKAPFRFISEHFPGSGSGRLQELFWSAPGAHLGLPGSSFAVESELIVEVARTRVSLRARLCFLAQT